MARIVQSLMIIVLFFSVFSCIQDDSIECISGYTVEISIKDKNYSNIAQVTQLRMVDENLPLNNYISNLCYSLREKSTGNIYMKSQLIALNGMDKYYSLHLNNIPNGEYELMVWGNLRSNTDTDILHADNSELTDLYLGHLNLNFTSTHKQDRIELERAKGLLIVLCINFPSNITTIEQGVTNVYTSVESPKEYSGNDNVKKTFPFSTMLTTYLAPTVDQMKSKINLKLITNSNPQKDLVLPGIEMAVHREEITVVSVNYNNIINEWEVSAFIDNQWTLIHQFKISEL